MDQSRTSCRVCGDKPLVGHYGLCQACADATDRFWESRRLKKQRQQEFSERQAKADAIRNRPSVEGQDADGYRLTMAGSWDVQSSSGGGGDQPGGSDPGDGV